MFGGTQIPRSWSSLAWAPALLPNLQITAAKAVTENSLCHYEWRQVKLSSALKRITGRSLKKARLKKHDMYSSGGIIEASTVMGISPFWRPHLSQVEGFLPVYS